MQKALELQSADRVLISPSCRSTKWCSTSTIAWKTISRLCVARLPRHRLLGIAAGQARHLVNAEPVDALSAIVHRDRAHDRRPAAGWCAS